MTNEDSKIVKGIRNFISEQDRIHAEEEIKNKPIREKYEKEMKEWDEKEALQDSHSWGYITSIPAIPNELKFEKMSYPVAQQLKELIKEWSN